MPQAKPTIIGTGGSAYNMATQPQERNPLAAAITLAKEGKKKEARLKFLAIIKDDPHEVMAYLWLVDLLANMEEKAALLERCLLFNPESQMAQDALDVVLEQQAKEFEEEEYELPKASMAQYIEEVKPRKKRDLKKLIKPLAWSAGILVAFVLIYLGVRALPDLKAGIETPQTELADNNLAAATWTPPATSTPTITPTATPGLPVGFGTPAPPPAAMISAYDVPQLAVFSQWGSGILLTAAWMEDGNVVAVTSRSIDVLDAETNKVLSSFSLESPVRAASICSTEQIAAVQTADGVLQLLSFAGELLPGQPAAMETEYQLLKLSPDCVLLGGVTANDEVIVWDVNTGEVGLQLGNIYGEIAVLDFSADHSMLAMGTNRNILWLMDTQNGAEIGRLTESSDVVDATAFSADGSLIAFGSSADDYVTVWNIEENRRQRTIILEKTGLTQLAYGNDGVLLAIGYETGEIFLRNEEEREIINHFSHYQSEIIGLTFDEAGEQLLSMGVDGRLLAWGVNAEAGKTTFTPILKGSIFTADITPNGQLLALGGSDSQIHIFDVASQTEIASMRGHLGSVWYVDISPDGNWLLSGGRDGTVRLWSLESFEPVALLGEHGGYVRGVTFSPDGKLAVSASADEMVKVWDIENQVELHTLVGHTDEVQNAFFSADGKNVFSIGDDGTLRKWDVESGRMLAVMQKDEAVPYLSGELVESDLVLIGDDEGQIDLWNTSLQSQIDSMGQLEGEVSNMDLTSDDGMLAVGSDSGDVILWDVEAMDMTHLQHDHDDPVISVAFTANDREFFTVDRDGTIVVWDMSALPLPKRLHEYQPSLASADINEEQELAAVAGVDGSIQVFNLHTGSLEKQIHGSHALVPDLLAMSPGGNHLAGAIAEGPALALWDMNSGKTTFILEEASRVTALLFEPGGRVLMIARGNHAIERRDIRSGAVLETLRGHSASVGALAFAPNEATMASGSSDGMIFLWDMDDNSILQRIHAHSGAVTGLTFSDSGEYLYSTGVDGKLHIWRVTNGELFDTIADETGGLDSISVLDVMGVASSILGQNQIGFWTNASVEIAQPLSGFYGIIQAQQLSADGMQLLTVDGDGVVQSYQVAVSVAPSEEEMQAAIATHTPAAQAETEQESDSNTVSSAQLPAPVYYLSEDNGTAQVWRLETDGFTTAQVTFEELPVTSFDVAMSSDYLAFVSGNDLILMNKTGDLRWTIQDGETIPPNAVEEIQRKAITDLHFSPDGYRLSYSLNGVHIYSILNDVDTYLIENLRVGTDSAVVYRPIYFSPGGNNLYIQVETSDGLSLKVISSRTGEEYADFENGPCCQPQLNGDQDAVYFTGQDESGNAVGLWLVDIWQDTITEVLAKANPDQINAFPIQDPFTGELFFFYADYETREDIELSLARSGADGFALLQVIRPDSYADLTDVLWAPDASLMLISDPDTQELMILHPEDRSPIHLAIQGKMMRWGN